MKLRWPYVLLTALLGIAAAVLPAIASSETSPTVTAENVGFYNEEHRWTPPQVTVGAGGAVAFDNPTEVRHGVHWINPPATPTCDSGVPVGATETETSARTKWSGACTFTQPGAYTYYCTVHGAAMAGRVTVSQGGVITTPTTTGTTTTPTTKTPPASPLVGAPSLRFNQHGATVRGSLDISQAGAGGRLEVDLTTKRAFLSKARGSRERVRVGRLIRHLVPAGKLSFSVLLTTQGKRALAHRHSLPLTVTIALSPTQGATSTVTRSVTLHS